MKANDNLKAIRSARSTLVAIKTKLILYKSIKIVISTILNNS